MRCESLALEGPGGTDLNVLPYFPHPLLLTQSLEYRKCLAQIYEQTRQNLDVFEASWADRVSENKYWGWASKNEAQRTSKHFICLYVIKNKTPFNVFMCMLFCLRFSIMRNLLYNIYKLLKKQLLVALF